MNRVNEIETSPVRSRQGNTELSRRLDTAFVKFAGSACLAAGLGAGMIASFVIGGVAAAGLELSRRRQSPESWEHNLPIS